MENKRNKNLYLSLSMLLILTTIPRENGSRSTNRHELGAIDERNDAMKHVFVARKQTAVLGNEETFYHNPGRTFSILYFLFLSVTQIMRFKKKTACCFVKKLKPKK